MFVTFEGIEGSGKTTLIRELAAAMKGGGVEILVTREPGGTALGDALRSIFIDRQSHIDPLAEAFLLNASRAQLVVEVIAPALKAGKLVLCDRFSDATIAYQGFGRGLDIEMLLNLALVATERISPNLTFLLDIPVEVSRRRVASRVAGGGDAIDRLEEEDRAFHERVRTGYFALAERFGRIVVLDATLPVEMLVAAAREAIEARLAAR